MSNFIYNSYCVVHPGAEQISLTAEYRPVQEAAAPVRRSAHFSFVWPLVAVMALLAAFASAGEGSALHLTIELMKDGAPGVAAPGPARLATQPPHGSRR